MAHVQSQFERKADARLKRQWKTRNPNKPLSDFDLESAREAARAGGAGSTKSLRVADVLAKAGGKDVGSVKPHRVIGTYPITPSARLGFGAGVDQTPGVEIDGVGDALHPALAAALSNPSIDGKSAAFLIAASKARLQ